MRGEGRRARARARIRGGERKALVGWAASFAFISALRFGDGQRVRKKENKKEEGHFDIWKRFTSDRTHGRSFEQNLKKIHQAFWQVYLHPYDSYLI